MKKKKAILMLTMVALAIGIYSQALPRSTSVNKDNILQMNTEEVFGSTFYAFWGLGRLIKSQGGDSTVFESVGVGVGLLFSAGGFVPGAIVCL